jgi:acylphosphatase
VSERVARRAVVRGSVQGVMFRQSALDRARGLGIAGWVRNRPDGAVELHAEGDPEAVDTLIRWAHGGPRHAHVEDVEVHDVPAEGLDGFGVR